jgi:tRNA(fMet)-specific endonuclease VapC
MRCLLDTNAWIDYLKHGDSRVGTRLRQTPATDDVTCSVVRPELLHGARKYEKQEDRVARVVLTLSPYASLAFDDAAAEHYAEIRDTLERRGEVIGPNDLMIAAIARSHRLIVVSGNREFSRVPGLTTEDWSIVPA